jgi:hypothetical protein
MNAVAPVSDKLDPLIRRLSTDKDGEVVACVRAIERQLHKAGLTFHDLADRLTAPEPAAEDDALPVFSDYAAAVEWLLATDCGDFSAREIDFLESKRGILRKWSPRPKQAAWLRSLVAKLGGRFDG